MINKETGELMPRIKTQLNAADYPKKHEVNGFPSMTVPGMSMTVVQMMERHRRGLPIDESKGALYQGDELLPDIDKMDLVDRQAYVDSVADALVEVKNRLKADMKSKRDKEILAKVEEAVRIALSKVNPVVPEAPKTE